MYLGESKGFTKDFFLEESLKLPGTLGVAPPEDVEEVAAAACA